jgi:hypothetical protein
MEQNPKPGRRWFRYSIRSLFVVMTVVAVYLTWATSWRRQPLKAPIDSMGAIGVAQQAVRENDSWEDKVKFTVRQEGPGWSVYAERQPPTPGGHRNIKIDTAGNVVEYQRG